MGWAGCTVKGATHSQVVGFNTLDMQLSSVHTVLVWRAPRTLTQHVAAVTM